MNGVLSGVFGTGLLEIFFAVESVLLRELLGEVSKPDWQPCWESALNERLVQVRTIGNLDAYRNGIVVL